MIVLPSGKVHVDDDRIRQVFVAQVQPYFKFDVRDRISIKSDVNQFNLEDKFVWEQARERRPKYHEVYWDGVWICDYSDNEGVVPTVKKFLFGFRNAYEAGQITLNTKQDLANYELEERIKAFKEEQRLEKNKTLEKAEKEIEMMPERTEEDKLSKQVLKEIVEEKKQFKQKKGKK
jgi:hypothetical protein